MTQEEQIAEKAVRDARKAELKVAKRLWVDSLEGRCKRGVYYTLLIKSTADGLYIGQDLLQFSNREIEYIN